ncbi:hypothetical protein SLS56_007084 [Neofusicoccum ribis]|uniref:Uncharacterized protein n=1 Tax=Neofusicoccum ribis TaxID=45134 RepID=A0ABR3SNX0_9PEZI
MDDAPLIRDGSGLSGIHLGTWTNWSQGQILGATLTLDRQNGGLLIAGMALFVTWVATSFWRICCLMFHRMYSTDKPRDGLYHQRQAILRNSASAGSGLTSLLQTGWAWRRNTRLSFCRTLPVMLFAALCIVAFAFASVFSSKISTAMSNEVLVWSPNCGYTNTVFNDPESLAAQTFEPYLQQDAVSYANYAQRCYHTNTSLVLGCSQFAKKSLRSSFQGNASCPFGGDICRSNSSNLVLDTGFLDSHYDFGLNTPLGERYQYRQRVQCAPLNTQGYSRPYTALNGRKYTRYYFGERIPRDAQDNGYTYEYYNESLADLLETNLTSAQPDYTLSGMFSTSFNGTIQVNESNWLPIPQLHIPNADISLFFLSGNQVVYTKPTNDSWYQGNQLVREASSVVNLGPGVQGPYFSNEAASPMACGVQVQYCNPSLPEGREGGRCSPLAASADALDYMTSNLSGEQLQQFQWFVSTTIDRALSLYTAVNRLGVQLLTSRYRLHNGIQGVLPDTQWQQDVQHWHATTLAHLQGTFITAATGPPDSTLLPWLTRPTTPSTQRLCRNQKILSASHTSFSLLYLTILLAAGALTILAAATLEPLLSRLQTRRHDSDPRGAAHAHARLEWLATSVPHLQRLAHEPILAPALWVRAARAVPVTCGRGEPLCQLDLADATHVRLRAPTTTTTAAAGARDGDDRVAKLPEMSFRETMGSVTTGGTGTDGGRGSSEGSGEAERAAAGRREEVLLSPLPDYDNWPLPPSGQLPPVVQPGSPVSPRETRGEGLGRRKEDGKVGGGGGGEPL